MTDSIGFYKIEMSADNSPQDKDFCRTDKDIFQKGIIEMQWLYSLKTTTSGVPGRNYVLRKQRPSELDCQSQLVCHSCTWS